MNFLETLGKRILFFDGAMGTQLQKYGLKAGETPELWNLSHPEILKKIHEDYLRAGSDIITTNTFGANKIKLQGKVSVKDVITAAVTLAKEVAAPKEKLVALDMGPTGHLLKPMGDLDFEEAYEAYFEAASAGEKAGADLILIETMSDTFECKAALLAAKEATSLPVLATMTFDEKGKLLTGGDIEAAAVLLESLHADAIGFNCGLGPNQMKQFLPRLQKCTSLPILIQPNAGLPKVINGETLYDVTPDQFASAMREMAEDGAWLLGGCCGTTPDYLRKTVKICRGIVPKPLTVHDDTVISSYSHAVFLKGRTILIGERINPTGKKRFQQALRENDIDYILREGIMQQENGADVLDVNVGLPDIDEKKLLPEITKALQGITDLPLQLDTSDPAAMENALRIYNGKPLINSVNGKQEVMDAIFPLVKKYGGAVIALTLDESGIPETADGRIKIAEKIQKEAQKYGIPKKDLIIDALAMTISAGQKSAAVTLETLCRVHEELGMKTSLGVSNISFGLPCREKINAAFFIMAMQEGLSAAIMNPNNGAMMDAFRSYNALMGFDTQCMEYINAYKDVKPQKTVSQKVLTSAPQKETDPSDIQNTFRKAIEKGLKESAHDTAAALLNEGISPLEIINQHLMPALDKVGKDFEEGTLFLPQLLMSAEAAKSAFEVLQNEMRKSGSAQKKAKIVLATVKGDIHDIGKNIVKVLLENYGYDVIDLGKDVDPQKVLEAVEQNGVKLCGLSALMTTTVVNMEETIKLLHQKAPQCKVMVGGAVLNPQYAEKIHADFYGKDAMGSVRYAEKIFHK
jgi:5-methyltetrahydrofolate--homocysteine methyltransferase